jgi:hypothetical protein
LKELQRMTRVNNQLFQESLCAKGMEHDAPLMEKDVQNTYEKMLAEYKRQIPILDQKIEAESQKLGNREHFNQEKLNILCEMKLSLWDGINGISSQLGRTNQ